jgi:hypothetical protein
MDAAKLLATISTYFDNFQYYTNNVKNKGLPVANALCEKLLYWQPEAYCVTDWKLMKLMARSC